MDQDLENYSGPIYSSPYTVDLFDVTDEQQLKTYVDAVRNLPKPMRQIMMDQSTSRTINEKLAVQFNLSDEQTNELTRIVRDVLISTLFVGDLVVELSKRLGVDQERAPLIANALIAQIFKPAMEDIKSMQVAYFPDRIG